MKLNLKISQILLVLILMTIISSLSFSGVVFFGSQEMSAKFSFLGRALNGELNLSKMETEIIKATNIDVFDSDSEKQIREANKAIWEAREKMIFKVPANNESIINIMDFHVYCSKLQKTRCYICTKRQAIIL